MEDVYQKRTRSNTIVPPEQRLFGRTVWVGNGTRDMRICGRHGELLTLEEYTKKREAEAAERRRAFSFVRRLRPSRISHSFIR